MDAGQDGRSDDEAVQHAPGMDASIEGESVASAAAAPGEPPVLSSSDRSSEQLPPPISPPTAWVDPAAGWWPRANEATAVPPAEIASAIRTVQARADARRGMRTTGLVLAASVLAAIAASVGTASLVIPPPATAPVSVAASTPPGAQTVVQVVDGSQAVVDVAARVSPAVVTITNSSLGSGFDPFTVPATGVGSGFVFRPDGLILTNWHVVSGAQQLTVAFNDGRQFTGRVVASDQNNDLAVVKVDATGLPVADLGTSQDLKTGQLVVAIGSPLGTFTDSVTSGIVSATGRSLSVGGNGRGQEQLSNLLQTDAAINEGNSGGPLLDASGHVVGINVAVATSAQGIGFAVPIDAAKDVIAQAGG